MHTYVITFLQLTLGRQGSGCRLERTEERVNPEPKDEEGAAGTPTVGQSVRHRERRCRGPEVGRLSLRLGEVTTLPCHECQKRCVCQVKEDLIKGRWCFFFFFLVT